MITKAVIGCGFGDEGKGRVVSCLCSQFNNPLVIRYSGGQQAGHKVIWENKEHICANFGSGALQGVDTYWSSYCTVDPMGIIKEFNTLKGKGVSPKLFIDKKCPITTPFEKEYNIRKDARTNHGSCCVGVGATYKREENYYSFLVEDLLHPSICEIKLELLQNYYNYYLENDISDFKRYCDEIVKNNNIIITGSIPLKNYDGYIFEGSQGLLLDQHFGFFPHVTPTNAGIKNILEMGYYPDVYYITRAYQTRHGNGPMTNEEIEFVVNNSHEHNQSGNNQGLFRIAPLDLDLLKYAISKDNYKGRAKLVVTCLDAVTKYILKANEEVLIFNKEEKFINFIQTFLGFNDVLISRKPYGGLEAKK